MVYNCEVCAIPIKAKSKYQHFKSNFRKEIDKCTHIKLTIENPDKNNMDRAFFDYIVKHKMIITSVNVILN